MVDALEAPQRIDALEVLADEVLDVGEFGGECVGEVLFRRNQVIL